MPKFGRIDFLVLVVHMYLHLTIASAYHGDARLAHGVYLEFNAFVIHYGMRLYGFASVLTSMTRYGIGRIDWHRC